MTKSKSHAGMTQRTYPMSDRSKMILDNINIVSPGYTKADLVNFFIFWAATSIKEIKDANPESNVKDALKIMRLRMANQGYNSIRENIMDDMVVTQLDRFFISVEQEDEETL